MERRAMSLSRFALYAAAAGAAVTMPANADDASAPQNDLLNATLWMQKSVEYKATTLGIFALAKEQLDKALAERTWTAVADKQGGDFGDEPTAIILDADETVLDNNIYEASLVTRGSNFSPTEWTQYVNSEKTKAIPGALEFTRYADSKGVKVFYISNRTSEEEPATVRNMKKLGFPMGGNVDTLLTKGEKEDWGSAKESRIASVAKDYRVLLLVGDNLGDFTDKYKGTADERKAAFEDARAHWGHDWIMLPNPEYGSWESSAFGGDYSLSEDERRQMKIDALDAWKPTH